jgi:DNA primase
MAERIPQTTIDDIRSRANIVDIVGQYVQLKKSGNNYSGLCPFHNEKTPSFSVAEDKQIFHCFGCGKGGNVFSFLQEIEGISFPEAVKKVADIEQIPVDIEISSAVQPVNQQWAGLYQLHDKAKELYHHVLVHTQIGEKPLQYLLERGLTLEVIDQFQLGYAPPKRDVLIEIASQVTTESATLAESGLFVQRDNGDFVDRFYQRIMFPIQDFNGRTIGFSGRWYAEIPTKDQPKYLNSPETQLFNKRDVLYNFDLARKTIRKENTVYLFEGFMDVIAATQAGIENGIASMGTSLTNQQISAIERACGNLIIAYDGDNAGFEATHRAIELLKNHRFALSVASFPEKLDPDEYARKYGLAELKTFLTSGRQTVFAFQMKYHRLNKNLSNEKEQLDYLSAVLNDLAQVQSPIEQDVYLKQLTDEFGISRESLKEQLRKLQWNARSERREARQQQVTQQSPVFAASKPIVYSQTEKAERMLLYRVMFSPASRLSLQSHELVFVHEKYQEMYVILESYLMMNTQFELSDFLDYLKDDELKRDFVDISYINLTKDSSEKELADLVQVIRHSQIAEQIRKKQNEQREARKNGNAEQELALTMTIIALTRKLKQA